MARCFSRRQLSKLSRARKRNGLVAHQQSCELTPTFVVDPHICGQGKIVLDKSPTGAMLGYSPKIRIMRLITGKQTKLAIERVAGLLKRDGAIQTLTVQEWLDSA